MQEIVHNINLNLSQPNNFEYIHIMQGDYNSEKVIATLFDGNKLYTIDAQKASLQGSTSDGGLILQDGITISADKHQVTFNITKEMSSCTGELTCNIVLSSDNQKKSTFPFVIKNTADITGRAPVSVLTTISDYVDRAEKAAKDSETNKVTTDENVIKATEQATIATNKATESDNSAQEAAKQANIALTKAEESATSAQNSKEQADISTIKAKEASDSATASADSATQAGKSATIASEKASDASASANSASASATNASKSETNAKTSADSASLSATNASTSETNAQSYATASSKSAQESATSESNAKQSATNAKASETSASKYASSASISATIASDKADVAITKATESANSATDALTYTNQSKDYRDQCKSIAQGLEGALLPKGTIAFTELPTDDIKTGDMYNISDDFTSDDRFKDGAGKVYTAGTNIYYTSDGLWDVLIGDLEKYAFKTDLEDHVGDKSNPHGVTKAQVGLGNVPNVATNDQTVTYTDSSTLTTLSSGEKMSVAFGKIKKAISDLISHIADTTKHITSSERTLWNTVSSKVDKVDGKGLSTNDYTTAEKNKLNGIESGANKYVHPGSGTNPHGTTKSDVGLGNVDNTADVNKSVKSSTKLETYKVDSTTETYGDNYPVYAQWRDSSHVKMKCDNYTVETDYATNAGSAANASKVNNHTVEANVPANAKFTDTNTWRGIQDNLTSDSTTDSLSANQGKILNDSKLMHETITTNKLDINTLTKTGIYHIKTTTCLNVPTNNHATLFVDNIVGTPYQIFMPDALTTCMYKRTYIGNDTWTSWTELKFTDTDTWRGIQNNLTSDSTTDSLSAAQGKVLKGLVDGKAASGHTHSSVSDIVSGSSTTFAYSKSGLDYGNYTWLAGWNGYELRAVNKSQFLASSGGTLTGAVTMNAALTFGKNDSYGIFPNTTNYGSIGSSSKYFYQSFITNMSVEALKRKSATGSIGGNTEPFNKIYVKNIIVPDKFYLRPSSTTSSDVEYTDVDRSVWLHGFDGSSVNGKQAPGLLLRQGSSFYQIFPSDGLSGSAATDIGHTQYKFRNIVGKNLFSDSGTVSTSDRNLKHDIQDLTDDTVEQLIDGISPKSFKFNDGTSGRTHYGLIAQDLEDLLISLNINPDDFAPLVKVWNDKIIKEQKTIINEDGQEETVTIETQVVDKTQEPTYHVRYEEFIMILVQYCQNLKRKNTDLEDKYNELTSTVNEILKKLN